MLGVPANNRHRIHKCKVTYSAAENESPMPYTIIFDKNYIRGLGPQEFLRGEPPETLRVQLEWATHRGDSVVVVDTVRTEFNAFLADVVSKANNRSKEAFDLLTSQGYTTTPAYEPRV
jgi:hypothetical protein